jgi:hypothetical protein
VYTVFALYSPSPPLTLSPPPTSSQWYQHPRQNLFLLFSDFVKEKKLTFLLV